MTRDARLPKIPQMWICSGPDKLPHVQIIFAACTPHVCPLCAALAEVEKLKVPTRPRHG